MKPNHPTLQVMVIDNDETVRESLITFLAQENMAFLIFPTATEGLKALKYQRIDVILSDYFLPDINGLSFLEKAIRQHPGLMTFLMSTIVTPDLQNQARKAGIDALVEKPISIACIEQIIETKARERRLGDSS